MTLEEFFRKARRGRKWAQTVYGVRCAKGYCPLGAVWNTRYATGGPRLEPSPSQAAAALGITPHDAYRIQAAADFGTPRDLAWLLKNLGVSVPPTTGHAE